MKSKDNLGGDVAAKPAQKTDFDKVNDSFFVDKNKGAVNYGIAEKDVEQIVFGLPRAQDVDELLEEVRRGTCAKIDKAAEFELITAFEKVPERLVFSEVSSYRLYNRKTKRDYYINGKMLESRIGLDSTLYQKVKSRAAAAFSLNDYIVVFLSSKVQRG